MKYILTTFALIVLSLTAFSQVDYFTLPRSNGELQGMVEHRAPTNPNGKKDPVILWLHGVDANVDAQPANVNDTTRIAVVTNKGPLRLVRGTGATYSTGGSPLPLFQKPGTTGSENQYRWNIVAPQNPQPMSPSSVHGWRDDVIYNAMEYIRDNPQKWDTSCIILVGYSLGGRATKLYGSNANILPYVKLIIDIAGGVDATSASTTIASAFAASGVPHDFYFTVNDELVGEAWLDSLVNRIKRSNPKVVPNYIRMQDITQLTNTTNPEHDFIEVLIARATTTGATETCTNGNTWTLSETIYQKGLRFMGIRRQ